MVRLGAGPLVAPGDSGSFGGAEVRAWTFARGLARVDAMRVMLVIRSASEELPELRDGVRLVRVGDLTERSARISAWSRPIRRWLRKAGDSVHRRFSSEPLPFRDARELNPHVWIAVGMQDPAAAIVRRARQRGQRSVVLLTSDEDAFRALGSREPATAGLRRYRYALLRSDLVVAQTEFQKELLAEAGQRAVLIRNPIELPSNPWSVTPLDARDYVLWVGRADTDSKRADLLAELAARCPQVRFLAIMNPLTPRRGVRPVSIQLPANVAVIPQVAFGEMDRYFARARALVNTSDSEGFPNTFLQAARHGVPILSRRVDPDFALTRHGIGFTANDQMDRLAEMVRQLQSTPAAFQQVSEAAITYVRRFHEASARVAELQQALRTLVECRNHAAA
jgi:glycosyltransferase involved in cell wall biosynthesis